MAGVKQSKPINKAWLARVVGAQQAEQKAISRLLHDEFGQSLVAAKSFAVAVAQVRDGESFDDIRNMAGVVKEMIEGTYVATYDLMRELDTGIAPEAPFAEHIQGLLQYLRFEQKRVALSFAGGDQIDLLPHWARSLLLRFTRTLLTCINRHASGVSTVKLTVSADVTGHTVLAVEHNGAATAPQFERHPILLGLARGVQALGGECALSEDKSRQEHITLTFDFPVD